MSLRDHSDLPLSDSDKICAILTPIWDAEHRPKPLSKELLEVVTDVERRAAPLKALIVDNAGLGQGRAYPENFIDPAPLLKAIAEFESSPSIKPVDAASLSGAQKEIFRPVTSIGPFLDLPKRISSELKEIESLTDTIRDTFDQWGLPVNNPSEDLAKALKELIALLELQYGTTTREPALSYPNRRFDQVWEQRLPQTKLAVWTKTLEQTEKLIGSKNSLEVVKFDAGPIYEFSSTLEIIKDHIEKVAALLAAAEKDLINRGGDRKKELLDTLDALKKAGESLKGETES